MNKIQTIIINALKELYGESFYVPDLYTLEETREFINKHSEELTESYDKYFGGGIFVAGKLILSKDEFSEDELLEALGESERWDYFDIEFCCYDYYSINNFKLTDEQYEERLKELKEEEKRIEKEIREWQESVGDGYIEDYNFYRPNDNYDSDWDWFEDLE